MLELLSNCSELTSQPERDVWSYRHPCTYSAATLQEAVLFLRLSDSSRTTPQSSVRPQNLPSSSGGNTRQFTVTNNSVYYE
jgi:hypothetical protein